MPESLPIHTDTLSGTAGYFTEGLKFFNESQYPINFYHLIPEGDAFTIFRTRDNNFGTAIAYETETYKTIGTIFEFGELQGLDQNSTREELMQRYLDFFGIVQYITSVEEPVIPGRKARVGAYPNPSAGIVYFSLEMEEKAEVVYEILTIQGTRIFTSEMHIFNSGNHLLEWHPEKSGAGPGMYIYRLRINDHPFSGKILLVN
jgi:hypothetical protein